MMASGSCGAYGPLLNRIVKKVSQKLEEYRLLILLLANIVDCLISSVTTSRTV